MSTKLFKNTEGKVLMSVGNKLIKQPYEFGLAFQNRMGLNNYIQISGLNITQYGQVLSWMRFNAWTTSFFDLFFSLQDTNLDNFNTGIWTNGAGSLTTVKNSDNFSTDVSINGIIIPGSKTQVSLLSPVLRATQNNSFKFNKTVVSKQATQTSNYNISKILLGAGRTVNGSLPNKFTLNTNMFNRFVYFDRELPLQEYYYYYNNGLGNDLQTTTGLMIDLYCDKAEILDFSIPQNGSDMRVGCRDYSGFNRHGEIMNLPAGTAQQKVDYANANLFVPFQ